MVDFILGLSVSHRKRHVKPYNAILVVIDLYTKQECYFSSQNTLDAVRPAEIFTRKLVLQGANVPQSIVSDCGP